MQNLTIRPYSPSDYKQVAALYKLKELYGGVFDENRDSNEKLKKRIENDPDSILVAEEGGKIVGTVSLIEDGRVAWLFRFVVIENNEKIIQALLKCAEEALLKKGHHQVLVYTPSGNKDLYKRYKKLGFTKGADYTCYWMDF